jgi:septal ring factor EnvC (AmiA/AmiB activator)
MPKIYFFVLGLFLFGLPALLSGQSRSALEKQRNRLQRDIQTNNRLLKENKVRQQSSVSQLQQIQANIQHRTELIANLQQELVLLQGLIEQNELDIRELLERLSELKTGYAQLLKTHYVYLKTHNELMLIVSGRESGRYLRSGSYVSRMQKERRQKALAIQAARQNLEEELLQLETHKQESESALIAMEHQKQALANEQIQKENMLRELRNKEGELMQSIAKKQMEAEKLSERINEIIRKEIEAARKKAEAEARKKAEAEAKRTGTVPKPLEAIRETPESAALSSEFSSNKGKLPWPVERGMISGRFGRQAHPVFNHVEIQRDGVDIDTDKGSQVRAVFKGEVSTVIKMPGYEHVVIIRHGRYLTVYGNLTDVQVKKGEKVTTRQRIARAFTQEDSGRTMVHFRVMLEEVPENPELWMAK